MSSEALRVIVDDATGDESSLKYGGTWGAGGANGEHNKTTHYTTTRGASTTVNFYGSSIRLVGTLFNGEGSINLTYTVDAASPVTTRSPEGGAFQYHKTFLQADVPDGEHSLVTTLDGEGITLCIDYFLYNTTLENILKQQRPVMVLVDDTDTNRIAYNGSWTSTRSRPVTMDLTEHVTSSAGSTATFDFYGTYVAVYGTFASTSARSTYAVDGGTSSVFENPPSSPPVTAQRLFEQKMADGQHKLVISSDSEAEFSIDYIIYSPSLSESVYNNPSSVLPSNPSTPTSSSSSSSGPSNTGAIVGGVVGGVVGLLALGLVALFLIRKRRKDSGPRLSLHVDDESPSHHPMLMSPNAPPSTEYSPYPASVSGMTMGSTYAPASSTASTWQSPPSNPSGRAQDGGVRVLSSPEEEEALNPPAYLPNYPTTTIKN